MKYVSIILVVFFMGCTPQPTPPQKEENTAEPKSHHESLPMAAAPIHVGIIGDWGTGSQGQRKVFQMVQRLDQSSPFNFLLTVGDNFYPSGVDSVTDEKWRTVFEETYGSLGRTVFASLGNHDHRGHVGAQVAYSQQKTTWRMPARYYSFTQPMSEHISVLFVAIDTEPLWQNKDPAQLKWIEHTLKTSQSHWKIVFGHHPIFSSGPHGDNESLIKTLEPILVKNQADVYIAGHDHALEINRPGERIVHVVSGGGGGKERAYPISPFAKHIYGETGGGFISLKLSVDALEIQPHPMGKPQPQPYILTKQPAQPKAHPSDTKNHVQGDSAAPLSSGKQSPKQE